MSEAAYSLLNDPRIAKMDATLDRLVKDVSEIKSDISNLKIDIALIKADSAVTRSNITELKADMRYTRDRALKLETNVTAGFKSVMLFCAFIAALVTFSPKIFQILGFIK